MDAGSLTAGQSSENTPLFPKKFHYFNGIIIGMRLAASYVALSPQH
jgi:hypothetical protein